MKTKLHHHILFWLQVHFANSAQLWKPHRNQPVMQILWFWTEQTLGHAHSSVRVIPTLPSCPEWSCCFYPTSSVFTSRKDRKWCHAFSGFPAEQWDCRNTSDWLLCYDVYLSSQMTLLRVFSSSLDSHVFVTCALTHMHTSVQTGRQQ